MRKSRLAVLAGLFLLAAVPVAGEEGYSASPGTDLLELGTAVSDESLVALSARQDISIDQLNTLTSQSKLDGAVGNNVLTAGETGVNSVATDAFGNMNGIATIIQNSGNQVLIQNSFILNVLVQ